LKAETKLNQSQISAKYLINFTPNCFAWAAAVINVELGSSIAEKSSKFFHLCAIQSILHKPANSVQNSRAELQNSGIPSSSGKRRRRGKGYLGDIQAFTFTLSGLPTVSVLHVLNIFHMGSSNVASGYQ